jgi:hypothetical protein
MQLDTRREALNAGESNGQVRILGLRLFIAAIALTASAMSIGVGPGEVVLDDKVGESAGRSSLACAGTLAASSEQWFAVVAYYNPDTDAMHVVTVAGTAALITAGAAKVTDAQIEAALPSSDMPYTVKGQVKFVTTAGSACSVSKIDNTAASYGVDPDSKAITGNEQTGGQCYRPWGKISVDIDAADLANADVLAAYPLPLIAGRIARWRIVATKAITTAAKTCTLTPKINTTAITGAATAYAGAKALGVVTALTDPTGANTFRPGDTLTITGSATTAFVEGRVKIEFDIEEDVAFAA